MILWQNQIKIWTKTSYRRQRKREDIIYCVEIFQLKWFHEQGNDFFSFHNKEIKKKIFFFINSMDHERERNRYSQYNKMKDKRSVTLYLMWHTNRWVNIYTKIIIESRIWLYWPINSWLLPSLKINCIKRWNTLFVFWNFIWHFKKKL